ncbi:hypothetical protein CAL13_06640 [Bordetella genomosp. 9]|uniref:Uncharacterized protein n=1 Tax=Bordetella genomosp. 9 TaxID=1416803 RepID=A0A1W6YXT8_9BORD|nr:hypothetical protein CAL13_06640 [Bordetella genomosp. 9]ARP89935.1 hypothetical protein CAL14_06230 [Bordetella genomosp. 9]
MHQPFQPGAFQRRIQGRLACGGRIFERVLVLQQARHVVVHRRKLLDRRLGRTESERIQIQMPGVAAHRRIQ